MAKNFYTNIDLNKNQLLNAVIQPASSAPENPKAGQIYFNTYNNKNVLCVYDETNGTWRELNQIKVTANQIAEDGAIKLSQIATWKGEFNNTTAYAVGDIVKYGVSPNTATYICIAIHTAGDWDATHFQILGGAGSVQGVTVGGTSIIDTTDNIAKLLLGNGLNLTTDTSVTPNTHTLDVKLDTQDKGVTLTNGTDGLKATLNIATTQGTGVTVIKDDTGNTGLKVSVQEGTTGQKGIVQLTNYIDTTDDTLALDGKAITELAVGDSAIATVNSDVVTIHGIKEENGKIAISSTNDIVLAKVAKTGAAADVSVDNSTKSYLNTTVQGELEDVYTNEAVTITTPATPTSGSKRTYVVKQIGTKTTAGEYDLNTNIEIPELTITKVTSGITETGIASRYTLTYGGSDLSPTIDIPKDWLLKAAYADQATAFTSGETYVRGDIVTEDGGDNKTLYVVKTGGAYSTWEQLKANAVETTYTGKAGRKYLVMWMNVKDSTETDQLILIDLTDFAPIYSASNGIKLNGVNFEHTNSTTEQTTAALDAIKFDEQGHITGVNAITVQNGLVLDASYNLQHTNDITATEDGVNHVVAGQFDAQGHLKAYDGTYVSQVKCVTGTLTVGATSVNVLIPDADKNNAGFKYMYTKTSVSGEECVTDVAWDSTNKQVTVTVANALSSAMDIEVFYSIK